MALGLGWKLHGDGKTMGPDDVVAPDERLSWGRTVGLGAQHVVAMFGATFVFPLVMGLNAQLAIMMSGIATICFLLIVAGQGAELPRHVGELRRRRRGDPRPGRRLRRRSPARSSSPASCSPSSVWRSTSSGRAVLHKVLPPVVTGAVVMLIGFNLAPVVANIYWPQDQWVALLVMTFTIVCAVAFKGFIGRIAVFLALIFGYVMSWLFDKVFGQITSFDAGAGKVTTHFRTNFDGIAAPAVVRLPAARRRSAPTARRSSAWHAPSFSIAAILLVLPGRHRAHRREHRPRQGRRRDDEARPRPLHGPRHRRRRLRHRARLARSAARRRRPTPRTSASWRPPASTPPPPTTSPRSSRSSSASRRSSARSWRRCRAACSAASPSCSTA